MPLKRGGERLQVNREHLSPFRAGIRVCILNPPTGPQISKEKHFLDHHTFVKTPNKPKGPVETVTSPVVGLREKGAKSLAREEKTLLPRGKLEPQQEGAN